MRSFYFFALLFFIPFFSIGQSINIDSFFVPGASWTEVTKTSYWPCSAGVDVNTIGLIYKIERDTIISGTVYHLLSSCSLGGFGYNINCSTGIETYFSGIGSCPASAQIIGRIRIDSNRVYFTLTNPPFDTTWFAEYCDSIRHEYLFYDYDLEIGSTFTGNDLTAGIVVSSIDSVSLSSGIKVAQYNDLSGKYWIYGIGARTGFIPYRKMHICGPGPDVAYQYTLCYDNPRFNYHFTLPSGTLPDSLQYDCFDIANYLNVLSANLLSQTVVYPNPLKNQLSISAPYVIHSVIISNMLGQETCNYEFYQREVQADVSILPKGIYFLRINGTEVVKFIKE